MIVEAAFGIHCFDYLLSFVYDTRHDYNAYAIGCKTSQFSQAHGLCQRGLEACDDASFLVAMLNFPVDEMEKSCVSGVQKLLSHEKLLGHEQTLRGTGSFKRSERLQTGDVSEVVWPPRLHPRPAEEGTASVSQCRNTGISVAR